MASTYLTRTPSGAGNQKTYTYSLWVKRAKLGSRQTILTNVDSGGQDGLYFDFLADDTLLFGDYGTGAWLTPKFETTKVFRDTSGWYHIVVSVDTTQSTEADRFKMYVNGVEETSFDVSNYPSQNADTKTNRTDSIRIGALPAGVNYFDGSMSHVHFIDGTAYSPTAFGETDATTGEWKINTNPSVTYGTNGFFILKDGNSVTDQSGNGNNWSVGGGTLTKTEDCPSNVFATLNPLVNTNSNLTLSKGNNTMTIGTTTWIGTVSTLAIPKGKFYWEVKVNSNNLQHGILGETANMSDLSTSNSGYVGKTSNGYAFYWQSPNARKQNNNSHVSYGSSISNGDILMVAFDGDNGIIWVGKNGTWFNNATQTEIENGTTTNAMYSSIPTTEEYFVASAGESSHEANYNFGNGYFGTTEVSSAGTNASGIGIFEYDVPTGYTALSTKGLNL